MATYSISSSVVGEIINDPIYGDVEVLSVSLGVFKDGVEIGTLNRKINSASTNQEIREGLISSIRDIIQQDLLDTASTALQQRATNIQGILNSWELVL